MSSQILIVGPSWVGDMIMAQSLFKLIKQNNKEVAIDVLAPDWSIPILSRMPEVRQKILLPIQHGKLDLKTRYHLAKSLRAIGYKQAYILPNSWKSALIPFWAKIPKRTGWLGELRWGLINDIRYLNKTILPRMVQRYVALGLKKHELVPNNIPLPRLTIQQDNVAKVIKKFNLKITHQPILALCPGAAYGSSKRWPAEKFIKLANQKIIDGWQIWIFGSNDDKLIIDNITNSFSNFNSNSNLNPNSVINFAGKINLFETLDLFSLVTIVISNDSGLMHMAASIDKPLIAIYGSTSPDFTPPLGNKSIIIKKNLDCSPCFKRECPLQHHACMNNISVAEVLSTLEAIK